MLKCATCIEKDLKIAALEKRIEQLHEIMVKMAESADALNMRIAVPTSIVDFAARRTEASRMRAQNGR